MSPSDYRRGRRVCCSCSATHSDDGCDLTAEEVDAMVAEQLPTMPSGGKDEAPPYRPRECRGTVADRRVERTWREWDVPPAWSLSDDTSPEAIAASQREAVAEAVRELGPGATEGQISERAVLPVWVVRRRLQEMV